MANEKRLIDANALPSGWMLAKFTEINGKMCLTRTMQLSACPTVDAVEVIRCKDCQHSTDDAWPDGKVWCRKMCRYMMKDGFCSLGERKDNERKADKDAPVSAGV